MKQEDKGDDQGEQHQSGSHHQLPTLVGEFHPPAGTHDAAFCTLPAWENRGITRGAPHLLRTPHTQLLTQVTAPAVPTRTSETPSRALLPYTRVVYKMHWGR